VATGLPAQAVRYYRTPEAHASADSAAAVDGAVDSSSGAATLSIPIVVPPGPGGLAPQLALMYSSQAGDSPFGVGWSLPLGEIRCSARFGVPDYASCAQYELDGQLLVAEGPTNPGRYHTLVESFQRIEKNPAGGAADSWEVTLTNGTVLRYGIDDNGRIHAGVSIARWLLQQIEDTYANTIDIAYDLDEAAEPGIAYPSQITYAGGFRKVAFLYEPRPDELHDFKGGIERLVTQRLREIQVTSSSGGEVFQRRIFGYAQPGDYSTLRSRLAWTQLFGTDCPISELLDHTTPATAPLGPDLCTPLPAQEYTYTDETDILPGPGASGWSFPFPLYLEPDWGEDQNVSDPGVRFADVNGDGRIDLVRAYCTYQQWPCDAPDEGSRVVYLNSGSGWDSTSAEAQAWTASLQSLTYEQPSVGVGGNAYACGIGSVDTVTRGVVFSEWDYYFHAVKSAGQPDRIYRPLLSWMLVDLDGDGLADLVTSEAFGGIARRRQDCAGNPTYGDYLPVPDGQGEVRAAFRNTGDPNGPNGGWVRDDSLAQGLPLFSTVMIDDRYNHLPTYDCRGTSGNNWAFGGYEYGTDTIGSRPCMTRMHFHPVFLELDGDGKPELIALQPDNPETPWMHPDSSGDNDVYAPLYDNDYASRAWRYEEKPGEPGVWEWQRAAEFDLALDLDHVYTAFGAWDPYPDSGPQVRGGGQYDTDNGVRFADLNNDGLMDVISDWGVQLNRGGGDAASSPASAWCASDWEWGSPSTCPAADRYRFPIGVGIHDYWQNEFWGIHDELTARMVKLSEAVIEHVSDLNGDGWPDLYESNPLTTQGNNLDRVFLHSGDAIGGNVWVEDTSGSFLQPRSYSGGEEDRRVFVDLNSDGILDALFCGYYYGYLCNTTYTITFVATRFLDLIKKYDNGRGGTLEFQYTNAVMQQDDALEQAAHDHALAMGEGGVGSPSWNKIPVVTSVTTSGFNRTDETTTYAYADPRWDETLRTSLGFRLVEQTRPGGSVTETYFYQALGRAGRVSEQTVFASDTGPPLSHSTQDWQIVSGPSCPACPVINGSIADVYVGRLYVAKSRNEYGATLGADSGPERTRTIGYDDTYGFNFVSAIIDHTPNHQAFVTRREPWDDPQALLDGIIGLVAEERVADPLGVDVEARSVLDYWPSGRLKSRTQDAGPRGSQPPTSTVTTQWFYDGYGNVAQVQDPKGRNTYFCYDGDTQFADGATACPQFTGQTSHSVRVGLLDALENVSSFEPELASGRIVRQLAPGYADVPGTYAVLDAFGRAVEERVIDASSIESVVSTTTYRDFGEPGVLDEPYVETLRYVDAAGSDWIRTAVYGDGFGGAWRTVEEVRENSVVSYRGSASHIDATTRTRRETYALECFGDEHCSALTGLEDPAVVTTADALGRVLRIDTPHESGVPGIAVRHYFKATQGGKDYDGVRIKNPKGDLRQHLGHQGKVVWVDECHTPTSPGTTDLSGVSCGSADRSKYHYLKTGELQVVFDPIATYTGDYSNPAHYLGYEYDRLGRMTKISDPDGGLSESAYDATGNLTSHLNARGQQVTYQYDDPLDRPTGITTPAGEDDITFDYTAGFLQRTGVSSAGFAKVFTYDDLGRLEIQQLIMAPRPPFLLDFKYDLLGRQTEITYPGTATVVRYEYNGAYLERVCELGGESDCSGGNAAPYITDVVYDTLGRRTEVHTPAGERTFAYDAQNYRLTEDRFDNSQHGPDKYWMQKLYTQYDELGNIEEIDGSSSAGDIELSASYTYDARNRLETWSRPGGISETYDYDALGNLTLKGDQTNTYDYADRPHAIRSRGAGGETVNYSYDADGNVAQIQDASGTQHYSYDSRGRMTCVGSSAGACDKLEVIYDEQGQRIYSNDGTYQTYFVGDLFRWSKWRVVSAARGYSHIFAFGEQIAIKEDSRVLLRRLASTPFAVFGPLGPPLLAMLLLAGGLYLVWWSAQLAIPQMIAQHPSTATLSLALVALLMVPHGALAMGGGTPTNVIYQRIVVTNHLGSGVLYLKDDGYRFASMEYDPFGGIDQKFGSGSAYEVRFAGHRRERATGFYYMKARWYDPEAGRFASVDPVVGNKNDPQSHNAYSYVGNNPVNFTDPTGMCARVCATYGFTFARGTLNSLTLTVTLGASSGSNSSPASASSGAGGGDRFPGIENITITAPRGAGTYDISGSSFQQGNLRQGMLGGGVGARASQGDQSNPAGLENAVNQQLLMVNSKLAGFNDEGGLLGDSAYAGKDIGGFIHEPSIFDWLFNPGDPQVGGFRLGDTNIRAAQGLVASPGFFSGDLTALERNAVALVIGSAPGTSVANVTANSARFFGYAGNFGGSVFVQASSGTVLQFRAGGVTPTLFRP
jgi:RHS repeat-associated protein